jgi:hypothetical protein
MLNIPRHNLVFFHIRVELPRTKSSRQAVLINVRFMTSVRLYRLALTCSRKKNECANNLLRSFKKNQNCNLYGIANKMQQYQNLLLHVYRKLNTFRATHRPSSGAQNCTSSLWFCIREVVGRWVAGR